MRTSSRREDATIQAGCRSIVVQLSTAVRVVVFLRERSRMSNEIHPISLEAVVLEMSETVLSTLLRAYKITISLNALIMAQGSSWWCKD